MLQRAVNKDPFRFNLRKLLLHPLSRITRTICPICQHIRRFCFFAWTSSFNHLTICHIIQLFEFYVYSPSSCPLYYLLISTCLNIQSPIKHFILNTKDSRVSSLFMDLWVFLKRLQYTIPPTETLWDRYHSFVTLCYYSTGTHTRLVVCNVPHPKAPPLVHNYQSQCRPTHPPEPQQQRLRGLFAFKFIHFGLTVNLFSV